jgi:predicted Zn-dependent peptidase
MSEYSKVPPTSATFNILTVLPGAINSSALNIFNQIFEEIIHDEIRVIRGWAYSTSLTSCFFQEYYDLSLLVPNFDLKFVDYIEETIASCLMVSEEKIKRLFEKKKKFELNTKVLADRCGHDILSAVISDLRRYQKINTLADDIKEIQTVKFEDMMEILKYLSRERCFVTITKP